jgi:hypothetical protein
MVSANYLRANFRTPRGKDLSMSAGEYELRVELTYSCPGGLEFNYTQPSALFRIVG